MPDAHDVSPPRSGRSPTILLVDDEPTPRAEAARLLRSGLGLRVCEARDGRHALRVFRRYRGRIDLVLIDFIMPHMDGGELAERVRDVDPRVPIVLMSEPLVGEAAELLAGYSDFPFLEKPFSSPELHRAVAPLLSRRASLPWRRASGAWRRRSGRDGVSS
jgi:CheY-like chemotaxis protein